MDNLHLIPGVIRYRQTNQLFENVDGVLRDATDKAGPGLAIRKASRGLAAGDVDNDGDVDLLVTNMGERCDLLLNESANGNNWLTVKLAGAGGTEGSVEGEATTQPGSGGSNRSAIGARLRVVAGDLTQVQEVQSGYSYLSASDLRVHFGLGERTKVDTLEITWPSGDRELIEDIYVNGLLVVHERGRAYETDWETGAVREVRRERDDRESK